MVDCSQCVYCKISDDGKAKCWMYNDDVTDAKFDDCGFYVDVEHMENE